MPNVTDAEYQALAENCNFRDEQEVAKLITSSYTETKFNEMVLEKHLSCDGAASYFNGFFGSEVWQDGQGMDEVREYSTQSYLPISNEYFVKKMKPCVGQANTGECDWEECDIPESGRGTLPGFTFYEWALKTPRTCIANIRHIRSFWKWAGKMIENRERADQQIMNMFFTMMAWKTAGHKLVLEHTKDASGRYTPVASTDPRNPFRQYSYNYMQEYFPDVIDPENIGPLSVNALEKLARTWTQSCNNNNVAVGSRGEKIWEMWYTDDWYLTEGHQNPDYVEKIRRTMPSSEFAGYSLSQPEREVIGNWSMKTMQWLPRLAVSSEGGLIPIDTHTGVDIEVGKEYLLSPDWQNAPFAVAMMPSPNQGTIMTRPDLTMSGDRIPILPITGSTGWRFRNDYDKDCNKQLNKPFAQKKYEMGFRMDDPDAGMAVIHRLRMFNSNAEQFCDLNPVFTVVPNEVCNDAVGIGCRGGKIPEQASFTKMGDGKHVNCTSEACGESGLYRIEVDRIANEPDFNSLGCDCGSTVTVNIGSANGTIIRSELATVVDTSQGYPRGIYYVKLGGSLATGECIKSVVCQDASPTVGLSVACYPALDEEGEEIAGRIKVVLDSPLAGFGSTDLNIDDTVNIAFLDADGVAITNGTAVVGLIKKIDSQINTYEISSIAAGFSCTGVTAMAEEAVSLRVTSVAS